MTSTAKDRGLWLTLSALTVLVVVLAVLQYRWVSELGRAEAHRRQAQLERAAWRFVRAFDREIGEVLTTFVRVERRRAVPGDPRARLLEGLAAWRTNEHAALVSRVLLASPAPRGEVRLEACGADDAAFHEVPWTPELEPLRQRLQAAEGRRGPFLVRPGTLLDPPLALLFPMKGGRDERPPRPDPGAFRAAGVVVLQLDPRYVRAQLLPQLAEAHFGPLAESEFVVDVVRRADRSVVFSSDPKDAVNAPPRRGDVERGVPGRWGRPEDRVPLGEDRPGPGGGPLLGDRPPEAGPEQAPGRPPEDESPWLLVARHRGGPLEVTVARVRRRNLAVGLGVLALLGATAAVLATGAQRARRLARQQMEFVAGVTHELNTPLAAIRSAGQNLADGIVTDPAQVRRYGGLIEKEGGRLGALVAQVLDFAGIESGNRAYAAEPLSVAGLVDEVLRDHRLVLDQAGMTVERDVAADLPEVRGDAAALRRALANLLANATKFAAAGRWVAVRATPAPGGRAVVLRVEDRGPGVPRDERARVFEPFYRGPAAERNATPGSGLGLSLVRHVVRAHGGSVQVEGREGGGTAVVVELPAAAAEEKAR
ncbi:MAG TPA: HAMP domain-containing sensor histidine kinase [Vicinamibacteria bacterium]|nr:HAMP domain-containing sensor histidine kinase [Vicinamibacteria bacterium]